MRGKRNGRRCRGNYLFGAERRVLRERRVELLRNMPRVSANGLLPRSSWSVTQVWKGNWCEIAMECTICMAVAQCRWDMTWKGDEGMGLHAGTERSEPTSGLSTWAERKIAMQWNCLNCVQVAAQMKWYVCYLLMEGYLDAKDWWREGSVRGKQKILSLTINHIKASPNS